MIRVLIADDSETTALLLRAAFHSTTDMKVVGVAQNGREVVDMAKSLSPDIITMDIRMPVLDGFEATREIMASKPTPIVVVSASLEDKDLQVTFKAVEAGALAVIEKPEGFEGPGFSGGCKEMIDLVRVMSAVKVGKRKSRKPMPVTSATAAKDTLLTTAPGFGRCEMVAIGCSMGGPQALQTIIGGLPADFSVPIIITQHISSGFLGGLVTWLDGIGSLNVKQAEDHEPLLAGYIYLAPDDYHLLISPGGQGLTVVLGKARAVNGFRPSASAMLESVAGACPGRAVGIILSGIGVDGASGLLSMRNAGCKTMVPDKDSSVVYGMPGAALDMQAVDCVENLDAIASRLVDIVSTSRITAVGTVSR